MSKHAATIINAIPNIDRMSYLELGTAAGKTFNAVRSSEKVGVDKAYRPEAMTGAAFHFMVTTDEFFRTLPPSAKYEVIFIDADHSYDGVRKDYNHAMQHLRPGGLLLIHDMNPPDEEHTKPELCGDGWKFLIQLRGCDPQIVILDDDFGLTCIPHWIPFGKEKPAEFAYMLSYENLPYANFMPQDSIWLKPLPDVLEWITNRLWTR